MISKLNRRENILRLLALCFALLSLLLCAFVVVSVERFSSQKAKVVVPIVVQDALGSRLSPAERK